MKLANTRVPLTILLVVLVLATGLPRPGWTSQNINPASTRSNVPYVQNFANIPIVGENSPDRQQVEPTIAVDPRNPNILVAGAQDLRLKPEGEHRWHGYYRAVDGGMTWTS